MVRGKVIKWIEDRGFGFISPDDGGKDIFVHARDLPPESSLEQGATVHFDIENDMRAGGKERAVNIEGDAIIRGRTTAEERKRNLDERADRRRDRSDSRDRRRRDRSDSRDRRRRRRRSPSESESRDRRRR
eukprot:Hpha_TRINITY_DN13957_c1_g1::TRINITY_DN13957_c1_g1_i2::g.35354::m.35354